MAARRRGGAALVVLLLMAAAESAAVLALSYPPPMHRPAANVSVDATLSPSFSSGALPKFFFDNTTVHGGLHPQYQGAAFGFHSTHDEFSGAFGWRSLYIHTHFSLLTSRERADLDFSDSVTRHLDASFRAAQVTFLTYNNARLGEQFEGRLSAQLIVVVGRDRRAAAIANVASFSDVYGEEMPELLAAAGKYPSTGQAFWPVPTSARSNVGTPRRWAVVLDAHGLPLVPAVAPARVQKLLYPMCAPPEAFVHGEGDPFDLFYRSNLTSRGFHVRWIGAPTPFDALMGVFDELAIVLVGSFSTPDGEPIIAWYIPGSWRAERDKLAFCLTRQANILRAVQRDVRAVVPNATVRSAFMVRVDNWYWQRAPAQLVFAQLADERLAVVINRVNEFVQPSYFPVQFGTGIANPPPFRYCPTGTFEPRAARTVAVTTHNKTHPLQGVPLQCDD